MSEPVIWIGGQSEPPSASLVGGKGLGLDLMQRSGLQVPEAFVVTTECFRQAVSPTLYAEVASIAGSVAGSSDVDEREQASTRARDVLYEGTSGHPGETTIREAVSQLHHSLGTQDLAVAVRSSSAAEDSASHSFAGEHDTYLWVRGADDVCEHVRRCWASLFTSRASAYRERVGDQAEDTMAVVVQRMIDARTAGVFMTLNPANGDRSKVVIESLWGLGEPLVSGTATPDRFTVDKITGEILQRDIADKPQRMTHDRDAGRGTCLAPVAQERREKPSLSDAEIHRLVDMGRTVEGLAGQPQDGEFAVADAEGEGGEQVYLLQTRPETVWGGRGPRRVGGAADALSRVVSTLTGDTDTTS